MFLSYHSVTTFAENTTWKCGRTEKQNPTEFRELALCWLPIFFVRERLKGTEIQFGDLYPIFFLCDCPGCPRRADWGWGSVILLPLFRNALRAVYGLLFGLIKSGAFTMSVWIAVPQPIAAYFHCTSTVLAEAFPSGFIAGDPIILHWLNYFEVAESLACKVVLELELGTAARLGFTFSEAVW